MVHCKRNIVAIGSMFSSDGQAMSSSLIDIEHDYCM